MNANKKAEKKSLPKASKPEMNKEQEIPQTTNSFFEDVWAVVRLIPKGRVTSYGAIARYLGTGMSARMVGWAMNACHTALLPIPAQRVVNRNGMLTGRHHFPSPDAMEKMLLQDGVPVEKDTVTDFKKRFWDPAIELAL